MASELIDRMAAGITQRKQEAATKLTPTTGEVASVMRAPLAGPLPVSFPWDYPSVMQAMKVVRQELADIENGLRIIEEQFGDPVGGLPEDQENLETQKKMRTRHEEGAGERATQRIETEKAKVLENLARKTVEAQAATFVGSESLTEDGTETYEPTDGWVCPTNSEHATIQKTSAKGRVFQKCTVCTEFER
jgi:hypothetical protein